MDAAVALLASEGSFTLGVMTGALLGAAAIRVPCVLAGRSGAAASRLASCMAPALGNLTPTTAAGVPQLLDIGIAARLLAELP
jgi:hypothetical protein